jgi:hypothetical protein
VPANGVRTDRRGTVDLPEHVGRLGAVGERDVGPGRHVERAADLEDEHGVGVAPAVEGHRAGVGHSAGRGVQTGRESHTGEIAGDRATGRATGDLVVRGDEIVVRRSGCRTDPDRAGDHAGREAGGRRVVNGAPVALTVLPTEAPLNTA